LDVFADFILKIVSSKMYHSHEMYGNNYFERNYDNNTILDKVEAEKIFLEWYSKGENYNYHEEPLNNKAGKFIVQHVMFIKIFLVYCHINYSNKLGIHILILL